MTAPRTSATCAINPAYADKDMQLRIKETLDIQGVVHLQNILTIKGLDALRAMVKKQAFIEEKQPLTHSWRKAVIRRKRGAASDAIDEICAFLKAFGIHGECALYSFGAKNYALVRKIRAECILDLGSTWDDSWGGVAVYTDGNGGYHKTNAAQNSMVLAKNTSRFIAYVNHHAKTHTRVLLIVTR